MGAVAVFNYDAFVLRYPEFASVDPELINEFFQDACMVHANDGSGPVCDPNQQLRLLNMVTAHITQLNAPLGGQPSPQLVGRITNASEGSVSVATEYQTSTTGLAQFFAQTKYGAQYWAATTAYRTMRYRRGFSRPVNPFYRGGGIGY